MAGELEIVGLDELQRKLAALAQLSDKELTDALLPGGRVLVREIKRHIRAQGLVDEGDLVGSITVEKVGKEVWAGTNRGYKAWIHEKGGIISKKRARELKFYAGGWKRRQFVSIPARPFMRPAVDSAKNDAVAGIRQALERIIVKKAGG